jgi:ferredoxin
MPFVVGIYEQQLARLDKELAELFEEYYQESRGGTFFSTPAVHRVVPVDEAVPVDVEIFPYESAATIVEGARAWAVRDCICRVQQRLIGDGCEHPVENCLVFGPIEGVFDHSEENRAITKEEALGVLRDAQEAGLVHTTGNYRDDQYYICNCCTCSCAILRGVAEFGALSAIGQSDFWAVVDADACASCGDCVERCQFGALALPHDVCVVDAKRCVGCGQCVTVCPTGALQVARRPASQIPPLAADDAEWLVQRAEARGISMSEIQ